MLFERHFTHCINAEDLYYIYLLSHHSYLNNRCQGNQTIGSNYFREFRINTVNQETVTGKCETTLFAEEIERETHI